MFSMIGPLLGFRQVQVAMKKSTFVFMLVLLGWLAADRAEEAGFGEFLFVSDRGSSVRVHPERIWHCTS